MDKIKKYFSNISYFIATFALIIIVFFLSFASIRIKIYEVVSFIFFNFYWLIFFSIHILFIYFIIKYSNKISEQLLFIIFTSAYLIFGIFLIINISPYLRADAGIVYKTVQNMRVGNFVFFTPKNYMNFYPHQHGLVYYMYLITSLINNTKFIFTINLFQVIAINYIIYKIVDILGNSNKKRNLLTIYLLFAFTQQLFFIAFAYNLIPGFFFMILGLFFLISHINQAKMYKFILSIIFFSISTIIRANYIIMVIAAALYLWVRLEDNKKLISIKFLLGFLLLSKLLTISMNSMTKKITGIEVSKGMPKLLWIAMGTDPYNISFGPGWYNGYNRMMLDKVDYDLEKSNEIAKDKIKENFNLIFKNPIYGLGFFGAKHLSTWADPTFESIWSGPLPIYKQTSENEVIKSIYYEGDIYWINYNFMKSVSYLIYAASLYYILKHNLRKKELILFIIYFVGGVIFHLFWETKSQYVYPYVILMIPIAVESILYLFEEHTKISKLRNKV